MRYRVTIENCSETYPCSEQQTLLQGMEQLGKRGIPVGCRGGGCGVCRVQVTSGTFSKAKMSRSVISEADESKRIVLACRCTPTSDLSISVVGKMEKVLNGKHRIQTEDDLSVATVG
ncbi:MAG: 2Fe-2S iron-sulfur cluster-binding protein [Candidatus Thiodiazotropha taylori]|nr:2Fe-2S iron-sulfur cluster-binding protein [Candidatus Thiodiazotropha taylori]